MHRLDLPRRYRTIYICDSFGIGAGRAEALGALRRTFDHLEPGGALVFSHDLPYAGDEPDWLGWRPEQARARPQAWPTSGERRRLPDGDDLELIVRERSFDPLLQERVLEVRGRRWRGDEIVEEEEHAIVLQECFAQEILLMLDVAGFSEHEIQGRYTGAPATRDDTIVVFVSRRPS